MCINPTSLVDSYQQPLFHTIFAKNGFCIPNVLIHTLSYSIQQFKAAKNIFPRTTFRKNDYLCSRLVPKRPFRPDGLKGNRVKIPDSPAAVKLYPKRIDSQYATGGNTGKALMRESVRRPAIVFLLLTGLVEKTVETNIEQTLISQISFRRQ